MSAQPNPGPVVHLVKPAPVGSPPAAMPAGVSEEDARAAVLTKLGAIEAHEVSQDIKLAMLDKRIKLALWAVSAGLLVAGAHLVLDLVRVL